MANIQPNTIIRLLHNVPLDNKYTDTLYWETASHQHANMLSLTKYTFTEQTYQRVNRNRLRVQRCADDIYDCNYLMFQNTAFGNKWFYAFITKVEYINNITSEIEYEIDDMHKGYYVVVAFEADNDCVKEFDRLIYNQMFQ